MKPLLPLALAACALALTACAQGNLRTPESYGALAPPPIRKRLYDPYAPYGSSDAIWRPPVYNNIVKPAEPASQASRPNYEGAEWATGAGGGSELRPPGTF